jgi:endonuclease III related protein
MTKLLHRIYRILLEEYGHRHKWYGDTADEIIIGAILTQNTNWTNVEKALANLRDRNLISLAGLAIIKPEELALVIRPSGYHNQKALRLISTAQALTADILPPDPDDLRRYLLSLKGLGPETADCIMLYAYGIPIFVIDAYTIRIFSRLGLCSETVKYRQLQDWFMQYLEKDVSLYSEFHALLIKLAKTACLKKPKCSLCPLQEFCAFALNSSQEVIL